MENNYHVPYPRGFQDEEWEVEQMEIPEAIDQENPEDDVAAQFAQNPQYYRYLLFQDDNDEEDQLREDEGINEEEEPIVMEDEDWDNEEYNLRFDLRLGFFTDEYDSGVDEPNELREPYNDFLEALEFNRIDEENRQIERFLTEQHQQQPPPEGNP